MRAIVYGLAASFFFAFTFVLNRSMDLSGGSWVWSAALRFIFMAPMLAVLVGLRGGMPGALRHLRQHWSSYLLWSTVGFGLFYAPLCFSSAYGEGWLVAGTWQIVIITGSLVAPLFVVMREVNGQMCPVRQRIPWRTLGWSLLILLGIALMQIEHAHATPLSRVMLCVLPIVVAAIAYPLGNRKMMAVCQGEVDTFQRVFSMTIASLPFWLLLSVYGYWQSGPPGMSQVWQSLLVAVFSGVVATLLFFAATNLARHDLHQLAAVEATQSGEVLFALLGEIVILAAPLPSELSMLGMALVIAGMVLHSVWPVWRQRRRLSAT